VSFESRAASASAIIGRNGSGKSTTLGLIAGVLKPSVASSRRAANIAPLLELGAGFHRNSPAATTSSSTASSSD